MGWSFRYLTVYISIEGLLGLCTNLCIRALGLVPRQTGWGHTEMIKHPLRYALLNVCSIV